MRKAKEKAIALLNEGRLEEAFTLLWQMGPEEFMPYILKARKKSEEILWLQHEAAGKYFWDEFIFQPGVLQTVFRSDFAEDFLAIYFTSSNKPGKKLVDALAGSFPETLIRSIRTNRVFLKPQWQESLSGLEALPAFKIHADVWKEICEIESRLWSSVQEQLPALNASIYEVLAETTIWLELQYFGKNDIHTIHLLGRIYSFFLEKILPHTSAFQKRALPSGEAEPFLALFFSMFKKLRDAPKNDTPVTRTLNAIAAWLHFYERICEPYCYDLDINPVFENEILLMKSSPEYRYASLIDGIRYEVMKFLYYADGIELVDYLEERGKLEIPKGNKPGDEEINRRITSCKYGTLEALLDLCISDFDFNDQAVSAEELLRPLITYATNRQVRYNQSLEKHAKKANWFQAFLSMYFEERIRKEPYLFMSEAQFQKLNQEAAGTPVNVSEAIIELFSYSPALSDFSRFDFIYDVWDKPFLKIDNYIFCPVVFWGANTWFYSFIQRALLIRSRDSAYSAETREMETHLGSYFEKKNWKVKVVSQDEANEIEGDADLIVEDQAHTLLIQLKRTYFRLNIKDSSVEAKMVGRKAAEQLAKAEKYLSAPNPVYKLQHPPEKWIASTSFENIHSEIKGCRKINYFELIFALKNPGIKTLKELCNYVRSDKHLSAIADAAQDEAKPVETREMLGSLGLPVPIFEPKAYKVIFTSADNEATDRYHRLFNEALERDKNGETNKAIELFHKCTQLSEPDADAWSSLANCLCDARQYEQGFICFEKALRLLPADPFITRNYAFALLEHRRFAKGLFMLIDLYEKYPLMSDFKLKVIEVSDGLIKNGLLSKEELELLLPRLQQLKK